MRTFSSTTSATTSGKLDLVDITADLEALIDQSGIRDGFVNLLSPQEGASIVVNERESGLISDLQRAVERLNGSAPSAAVPGSRSTMLPVVAGRLRLGLWQRVMVAELEESATRSVLVQIVGE